MIGTGSYTTSTTNMYNKYQFHVPACLCVRGGMAHSPKKKRQSFQGLACEGILGTFAALYLGCGGHGRARARLTWKSIKLKKNVSLDHTRPCIDTSNKNKKIRVRINSTVNVIRACIFIMLSVLEVTQRVPPTCTIKTDFTYGCIVSFRVSVGTCHGPSDCQGRVENKSNGTWKSIKSKKTLVLIILAIVFKHKIKI
jgi:hypothetical protein